MPQMPKGWAGWYLPVFVHAGLLVRESPTCGWVGGLPTRWVRGEEGKGGTWAATALVFLFFANASLGLSFKL